MKSWEQFESRLKERHPGLVIQAVPSAASANSARFLHNAFKPGIPNLQGRSKLKGALSRGVPWGYASKIIPVGPNDSEFFVCVIFKGENLTLLDERLTELDRRAAEGLGKPTNNTRFLMHKSGFYAATTPEADRIDPETHPEAFGAPIPVDEILYADVDAEGRLTSQEVDIVQRLRRHYSDPAKIVRLEQHGVVESFVKMPDEIALADLFVKIDELGGHYSQQTIESFHLNLTHNPQKHFVILREISGTGKSRLVKAYAYAVLGLEGLDASSERFVVVPVEPHWTDPSYLTGHEDMLATGGYRRTAFLEALLLANSNPLQPVFVLLDEMNRAQVEHYFSNFLSAMEIEGDIRFYEGDVAVTSGVPASIPWPRNLHLIGTINDDESVLPFSSMVLDRANSQDLSQVDILSYGAWLRKYEPEFQHTLTDDLLNELAAINTILAPFQLHFGNRTVREMALYIQRASAIKASVDPVDLQIDQKILPKLRGGAECGPMLNDLQGMFAGREFSRRRIKMMRSDLAQTDFFKYR